LQQINELQELEQKINSATRDLIPYYKKLLSRLSPNDNIAIICDYVAALNEEINPSFTYRTDVLAVLCQLSNFVNKNFKNMIRDDIMQYLNSLKKTEEADPLHKWIGTYNLRRIYLMRFFKWLYYPDIRPTNKRLTPEVVKDISRLKRREQSIYKPTDLWTTEEDLLFLKYCPSITGNCQYAEVLVNGKTGTRPILLIHSIPYVKDWLDQHPQLICYNVKSVAK
jgi:hypothetical protein